MFHKALWMRNFKQGKTLISLIWVFSIALLPIRYLLTANSIESIINLMPTTEFRSLYSYFFRYLTILLPLSFLFILLSSALMGGERKNKGMEFMMSLPFSRKDIFLSKWFFGVIHLLGITFVNLILMAIIHSFTIHAKYTLFSNFLVFFPFMFISLLTIYTVGLLIGTLAGKVIVQIVLTIILTVLPLGLYLLIRGMIGWHINWIQGTINLEHWLWNLKSFFGNLSLISINRFTFGNHTNPAFNPQGPTTNDYIILGLYLIPSLYIGLKLFKKMPYEKSDALIIHQKFEPLFLIGVVGCSALLAGELFASSVRGMGSWGARLIWYYFGMIFIGGITWVLIKKIMIKEDKKEKS